MERESFVTLRSCLPEETCLFKQSGKRRKKVFMPEKRFYLFYLSPSLAVSGEISCQLLAWPTAQCHGALHTLPTSGWKRGQTFTPADNTGLFFLQLAQESTWRSADAMTHLYRDSYPSPIVGTQFFFTFKKLLKTQRVWNLLHEKNAQYHKRTQYLRTFYILGGQSREKKVKPSNLCNLQSSKRNSNPNQIEIR